jgi:hypothetical protein
MEKVEKMIRWQWGPSISPLKQKEENIFMA